MIISGQMINTETSVPVVAAGEIPCPVDSGYMETNSGIYTFRDLYWRFCKHMIQVTLQKSKTVFISKQFFHCSVNGIK